MHSAMRRSAKAGAQPREIQARHRGVGHDQAVAAADLALQQLAIASSPGPMAMG
jgi:hypothetical protein